MTRQEKKLLIKLAVALVMREPTKKPQTALGPILNRARKQPRWSIAQLRKFRLPT